MDALLRRRAMIANAYPVLPYDPADYIETNGYAYLNTGIIQTTRNIEYTIKMVWVGSTQSQFESFLAYMASGGTTPRSGFHKYNGGWMFGTNATSNMGVAVDGDIHTVFVSGNSSTNSEILKIDNTLIGTVTTTSNGLSTNTIPYYLGCRNRNGSVDNPCNARFYSFSYKMFSDTDHTTIYREYNFIPVRYNGVFGMWETLTKTFFPSISGTDFTGQLKNQ